MRHKIETQENIKAQLAIATAALYAKAKGKMLVVCAWCNGILREGEGPAGEVSHGICQNCMKKMLG